MHTPLNNFALIHYSSVPENQPKESPHRMGEGELGWGIFFCDNYWSWFLSLSSFTQFNASTKQSLHSIRNNNKKDPVSSVIHSRTGNLTTRCYPLRNRFTITFKTFTYSAFVVQGYASACLYANYISYSIVTYSSYMF